LAYITSSYTYINITYILSQHIDRINIIIINTKNTCKTHLDLKKVYSYIYQGLSGHPNVYIQQKYIGPQARATSWYKNRLTSLSKIVYKIHTYNQGASIAPPAAPPSGGGGGPPPPAPGGGGGTSAGPPCPGGRRPLVIAASTAARRTIDRHGGSNPMHCSRNSSSWMQIHMPSGTSETSSPNDDVYHQNLLRSPPEEHVMAPHQGHQNGASSPVSQALLVAPQPHPTRVSLHVEVSPLAAPALCTTPPHAHEVPNLHIHKATTTDGISVYTSNICTGISKS
jgi:hypothetical protein